MQSPIVSAMESNPYQSPIEPQPNGDSQNRVAFGEIVTLPFTPWRLRRVAVRTPELMARIVGWVVLGLQCGLAISPDLGSISEPYADVRQCLAETAFAAVVLVGISLIFCAALVFSFGRFGIKERVVALGAWAMMPAYFVWLVCRFCNVLDAPHYGIINDDRMEWMTNPLVLQFGAFWWWLVMLVGLPVIANTRKSIPAG